MIGVVVLQRGKAPVRIGTQTHALHGYGAVADVHEHLLAGDDDFHRLTELSRGGRGERRLRPRPQFSAESRTQIARDDANVLDRNAEHLCQTLR